MSISFPTSPTVGQIYQNWVWNGTSWSAVNSPARMPSLVRRVFTASGAYTPSTGMYQADIEVLGGGGAGGGTSNANASTGVWGSGGGAGGRSRKLATAAQIGASQVVTIGAAGAAATGATAGVGGPGGASSVGTLCTANGGLGGNLGGPGPTFYAPAPAAPGVGDQAFPGATAFNGAYIGASSILVSTGRGADTIYGAGGRCFISQTNGPTNGEAASGYGAGGGGGWVWNTGYGQAQGGNGAPGIVIITEHCWS